MSHFIFKAKRPSGEMYSGQKDAEDRYELYRMIREGGDELISLEEKKVSKSFASINIPGLSGRVNSVEKINFARNLGAMLEAGLALSRALSVLERQTHNKAFKTVLAALIEDVGKGSTFSDALNKHQKIFPSVFIAMVHAGEQSGTLAESLKVVATQLDSAHALERRVRGALMYPSVIVSAMVLIAVLMFIFVIPTLLKTFTELNVELPFATRMVILASNTVQNYGLFVAIGFIGAVVLLIGWSRGATGKSVIHKVLLKLPVIGTIVQEVNAAKTARTLSSLIGSGVGIVEAVLITSTVIQNVHFRALLNKAADSIKKGEPMSKVFMEEGKLYPIFFGEMMSVGEETGNTGQMLLGVAHFYEEAVDQKTKDMSTIIEPVLMIVIGIAVGFFAISMIQPMYSLVNVI